MFQKTFSIAGTLLLAGAAVLMMPALSQAQHGGGHGGGGHFGGGGGHFGGGGAHFGGGGAHFAPGGGHFGRGGAHFAPGGGHFNGARFGGYRGGVYHGGIRNGGFHYGHPYAHFGYGHYRPYFGGYGYYPYHGLYGGYYPYNYDTSSPTYDSGYSGSYGEVVPDYYYGSNPVAPAAGDYGTLNPSSTASAEPDTAAHLTIKAPEDAHLWFNGTPTVTTGTVRQFDTPQLGTGKYIYDVQARWNENGHEVTETRQVEVTRGSNVEVDFPAPPRATGE